MKPLHLLQGVLVAVIWGLSFVASKIGLEYFSPPQLAALRFLIASVPACFLARPPVSWPVLIALGLTLFAGQFLLLFFGIAHGMPPGLASVAAQTQAFFTVLLAAAALGETPSLRQSAGMAAAFAGLGMIASTEGHDLTLVGLGLTLGGAVSWAVGNVLLKRIGSVEMLNLIVWLSVVPPLPSLALSFVLDGPAALPHAVQHASVLGVGAVLYLGLVATILAYAMWGNLLRQYPAATVVPFALLVPFVGSFSSAMAFGEQFGPLRLTGMGFVLLGLAIIVLPQH
ncbi:MAG TPA: EamA family transporter [bacterium]|nr:EamA family transporter [bacterium]